MRAFVLTLAACAVCVVTAACGTPADNTSTTTNTKTTTTNANGNTSTTTTTTTTNTNATTTATPAGTTTTASGGAIGVAECDEYINKYETCVKSKVPENLRATVQTSLDTSRKAWRDAAANPTTKASLPQLCKTAMDTARASMKAYGCDF
jgi:hypothetical protein